MNQRLINVMFALIRYEIGLDEVLLERDRVFVSENLESLYKLSGAHDVAQIIASALFKLKIGENDKMLQKFSKQQMLALYRYEGLNYELEQISNTLEEAKILFMPLKGALLRRLYPEPWMRTSCDIDVLVKEDDLARAVEVLKEKLAYTSDNRRNYHDISLYSPNGVHLELHFSIQENMESIDVLLSKVWDYAVLVDGKEYQYQQTNEYLFFHHIAHMSYHFVSGGCGIKPFLDLYLIQQKMPFNLEKVRELCAMCGLQKFYDSITELAKVWLEEKQHSDVTLKMQSYILQGGVYGTVKNGVAAKQGKSGGKLRYAFSRIFLSSKTLMHEYPCIKKHVWLTPFCQIHRWFKILTNSRLKRAVSELKANYSVSKEEIRQTKEFLMQIGL